MSPEGSLIQLIEDEEDLVRALAYQLEREGFRTRSALTATDGLHSIMQAPLAELVVLDLMLPDQSGLDVCKRLKSSPRTREVPILMLTASGSEADRVGGFEVGADDYVVKPFSTREVVLRIRALLRRKSTRESIDKLAEIRQGRLFVDPVGHRAQVGGRDVALTAIEFKLLHTLLSRRGLVQTRNGLLRDVWGIHADITTRTVDTHVKRLRRKLGKEGLEIETLRGVGYRFRDLSSPPHRDSVAD